MTHFYLQIVDDIAVARALAPEDFPFPEDEVWVLQEEGFGIGSDYIDGEFRDLEAEAEAEVRARAWRDAELSSYDLRSLLTDDPQHDAIIAYRQELRDWPGTGDFPGTRPTR